MKRTVSVLARPTPGDENFYKRWKVIGEVFPSSNPLAEVLVVDQHVELIPRVLRRYTNLEYVCSATTGHTHLKFDPEHEGIQLVTLRGETQFLEGVRSVAEWTLSMMLRLCRPLHGLGYTLSGKTVGVIGWGRIGSQVADLCEAFNMKVLCYDIENLQKMTLPEIFSQSDFITIHLSENESTRGLIHEGLIARMPRHAVLINSARASIVDSKALYHAVVEGRIRGAAVDFASDFLDRSWFTESPPPNLILTPHIAGNTLEDRIRTDEFIVEKLRRLIRQQEEAC